MSNQKFDPELLRVVGRLAWMKDEDEGHWFSIPSSNDQVIFNEEGDYVHSLTGARFEILCIHDSHGAFEIDSWPPPHLIEVLKFSDLVELGEKLIEVMVDSRIELWSNDPNAIFQWFKLKTLFAINDNPYEINDINFVVFNRSELEKELKKSRTTKREELKNNKLQDRNRFKLRNDRECWRKSPEYQATFQEVFGKSLNSLTADDPKDVIYHACCVVEYRLKLGRWSKASAAV